MNNEFDTQIVTPEFMDVFYQIIEEGTLTHKQDAIVLEAALALLGVKRSLSLEMSFKEAIVHSTKILFLIAQKYWIMRDYEKAFSTIDAALECVYSLQTIDEEYIKIFRFFLEACKKTNRNPYALGKCKSLLLTTLPGSRYTVTLTKEEQSEFYKEIEERIKEGKICE